MTTYSLSDSPEISRLVSTLGESQATSVITHVWSLLATRYTRGERSGYLPFKDYNGPDLEPLVDCGLLLTESDGWFCPRFWAVNG